jgi:hypothetical protein
VPSRLLHSGVDGEKGETLFPGPQRRGTGGTRHPASPFEFMFQTLVEDH